MLFIRQGATHKVVLGPAVAVGDGFTPVANLDVATADEAEAILHDNGTVVDISGYTWAAVATADGYYHLTLQNAISGTVGHLTIVINDDSLCLPLRADFTILDTAPYDANFKDAAAGPALASDVTTAHSTTDGKLDTIITGVPTTKYMGEYGPGVYLDSGAANENTTVGTDGTVDTPVSTFAAARTIANSIGLNRYYLEGNSDLTLGATHVDWEFCGIGAVADNIVNLGSQDVSRSRFCNLTLEGTQGGASRMEAVECALQDPGGGATTLHIFALRCGLVDDIEIDTSNNNVFESCYSLVAGATTPSIIATGAAGTLEIRHYSGGIELKALSASHNVSIEGMGQVVFNANCNVNANVSIRGLFTITDNTAGMASLTQDAVVNMPKINTEADTALSDINLDHLAKVPVNNNADMTTEVADGTVLSNIMSKTSDTSTFVIADDSLQANRDRGDTHWITATGFSTHDVQDVAQVVNRTAGVVYYVANDGNDSNDGLTPATAKLTPKTVVEAASANDVVILGPGPFALGDNVINTPDDIIVRGAGMDVTWLTSSAKLSEAGKGCTIGHGNNSLIEDMTIENTVDDGSTSACVGCNDNVASQSAFTNAVVRRVRMIADSDGIYLRNSGAPVTLTAIDCIVQAKYDGAFAMYGDSLLTLINCKILVVGPSALGAGTSHGTYALSGGHIRAISCDVRVQDGGASETVGYYCASSSMVEVFGGSVHVSGGEGDIQSAWGLGDLLLMAGVEYDRSIERGTITHVSSAHSALVQNKLDHLIAVADSDDVVDDAILAKMASTDGDWSKFSETTESLQSIRDGVLTDWEDNGRLDLLLDAVSTHDAAAAATAVLAATVDTITVESVLELLIAVVGGKTAIDGADVSFKKRDGSTSKITISHGASAGSRTASVIDN